MRSGVVLLAALALAPLALAACKKDAPVPPPPRPVVSEIVGPVAGLNPSYVGTVAARIETDLGFPLGGTLAERPVDEGEVVTKGSTLALLDPQDLDAALRAAVAGVTVATAQLNSAQDAFDRTAQLVAKGVDSPATAEAARNALAGAKAQLIQAEAGQAQAEQRRADAALLAPQDGVVTQVYVEPGAALTAGQAVLRLAATGEREVLIDLSEQDAAELSPGAVFDLRLEADPEIVSTAILRETDPVADAATRTRRLHLTLDPAAPSPFRLGALVTAAPGGKTAATLSLPQTALIGGGTDVWRVDRGDNSVHRLSLSLGPAVGVRVLVRAGLTEGDEIVVKGVNSIKDGQIVGPGVTR